MSLVSFQDEHEGLGGVALEGDTSSISSVNVKSSVKSNDGVNDTYGRMDKVCNCPNSAL